MQKNSKKDQISSKNNHWTNFQSKQLAIFLPFFWHLIPNNQDDRFKSCFFKKLTVCIKGIKTRKQIRTHFKWIVLKADKKNLNLKKLLRSYILTKGYQKIDEYMQVMEQRLLELKSLASDDQKMLKLRQQENLNYKKQIPKILKFINQVRKIEKFEQNWQNIYRPTQTELMRQNNVNQDSLRTISEQKQETQRQNSLNRKYQLESCLSQSYNFIDMILFEEYKQSAPFKKEINEKKYKYQIIQEQ